MENLNKMHSYKCSIWYYSIPIGRNELSEMNPEICRLGNLQGHKTNHSLWATGTSELYKAEVPEKIIQEWTGHRSLKYLRIYEKTSKKQAVSNMLSSSSEPTYQTQPAKLNSYSQNITLNSSTITSDTLPKMDFSNCQVNININQGPSAPVYFWINKWKHQGAKRSAEMVHS